MQQRHLCAYSGQVEAVHEGALSLGLNLADVIDHP